MTNCLSIVQPLIRPAKNRAGITDQPGNYLGACFDPFVSMINHSCSPNAFWTHDGKKLSVGAFRTIKAGEEIFISYIPPGTLLQRQTRLKKSYYFNCTCKVCRSGADREREIGFQLTPTMKALRCAAFDFQGMNKYNSESLGVIKSLLRKMDTAGFPDWFTPIPYLHALVVSLCLEGAKQTGKPLDTSTLVRSQLKVQRNLHERESPEGLAIDVKTSHLMQLVLGSNKLVANVFGTMPAMDELDPAILEAMHTVYWYDRSMLGSKAMNIVGADSELARFESGRLVRDLLQARERLWDYCLRDYHRSTLR